MDIIPQEVPEWLAYNADASYGFVKFKNCTFDANRNVLSSVFLFDQSIENKIAALKPRLEKEFKSAVNVDARYLFAYEKSYIDADILMLKVHNFLHKQFSVLTLDFDDSDIKIQDNPSGFKVSVYLPEQNIDYICKSRAFADFVQILHNDHFSSFRVVFIPKKHEEDGNVLEKLEQYMKSTLPPSESEEFKTDKSLKVRGTEYLLGRPIKERPVKIEFVTLSAEEQVIAGTIVNFTRREYTKKDTNEQKPYFTFILDDGRSRLGCVLFPNQKTLSKTGMLQNGSTVIVSGIYSERNGRTSFRVTGISFCELV